MSACASAGIERVVIVVAPGKESLRAYFAPSERIAERLRAEGRHEELEQLRRPEGLAEVRFVVQTEARGNGHAVLVAREEVGDVPFAMIWGDDVVVGAAPGVAQLVAARARLGGGSVAGAIRVPREQTSRYGILAGDRVDERTTRVRSFVEKPAPAEAASDLASVHGFVLEPEIFDVLARQPAGRGGEVWLTDAVAALAAHAPVWAFELEGRRYDAGDRLGYVAAFVDAALARADTGPSLREHLRREGWRPPAS